MMKPIIEDKVCFEVVNQIITKFNDLISSDKFPIESDFNNVFDEFMQEMNNQTYYFNLRKALSDINRHSSIAKDDKTLLAIAMLKLKVLDLIEKNNNDLIKERKQKKNKKTGSDVLLKFSK